MIVFKIIHKDYVETWRDYKKTSSFRVGARWNSAGVAAMYTTSNVQNAMLEVANYMPTPAQVNDLFRLAAFELPSLQLYQISPQELPGNWYELTKPNATRELGDKYLKHSDYDGLIVPSVTINKDIAMHPLNAVRASVYSNVILNPERIGVGNIKLIDCFTPIYSQSMFVID